MRKGGESVEENEPMQQNANERQDQVPFVNYCTRDFETSFPRLAEKFVCLRGISLKSKGQFR
jgi:hypothetical protein